MLEKIVIFAIVMAVVFYLGFPIIKQLNEKNGKDDA